MLNFLVSSPNFGKTFNSSILAPLITLGGSSTKFYSLCLFVVIIVLLIMLVYVIFNDLSIEESPEKDSNYINFEEIQFKN